MASVYKRKLKGGEVWYAQVKRASGAWYDYNTKILVSKKGSRKKAMRAAMEIQAEILAGRDPFGVRSGSDHRVSNLTEMYLSACREKGLRFATIRSYRGTLVRFREVVGDVRVTDIDKGDVQRFRDAFRNHSKHTQNIHLTNLRAFLRWVRREYDLDQWRMPDVKLVRVDPLPVLDYYNSVECQRLLVAAERVTIRCRCLDVDFPLVYYIAMLMLTGMRKMEAAETRWEPPRIVNTSWPWVDLSMGQIVVPASSSKSRRPRYIPILPELQLILESWPIAMEDRLFPFSAQSGKLTAKWRQVVEGAGVRYLKLHCLRDTFAVNLLLAGIPWAVVGEVLGHASVETTKRYYAAIGMPELQASMGSLRMGIATGLLPDARK